VNVEQQGLDAGPLYVMSINGGWHCTPNPARMLPLTTQSN